MNTNISQLSRQIWAVVSAAVIIGFASPALGQLSPVALGPVWDLTISGNARGIAQITFFGNGTLKGQTQIETRKKTTGNSSSSESDDRGLTGSGRDSGTGGTNSSTSVTNFFGSATIDGQWGFDPATQRILGFMNLGAFTVTATSTNATTNSVSFRGVVRGGSRPRLTLTGTSPLGRQVYQGIPLQALPDISGPYAAVGRRGDNRVVEFFTLTAVGLNNYSVEGGSLGYTYSGNAILSGRKQLSILTEANGTNGINFTEVVGSFSTNKLTGTLKGRDLRGPVSLKVFDQ